MSGEFSLRQELHVLETMNRSKKREIEQLRAELEKVKAGRDELISALTTIENRDTLEWHTEDDGYRVFACEIAQQILAKYKEDK